MHHRRLGRTGIDVSMLGLGSSPFRHGDPQACGDFVREAVECGINYYDTARSYVNGEEAIAWLAPSVRERLVVTTKTGARGGPRCLTDLQTSLRTMRTSWIDVWMTHMLKTEEEYEQCLALGGFCDVAAAARNAGLIRASGVSFHAPTELILRAIEEGAFDVVMFQLNAVNRETVIGSSVASYRERLLPAAQRNGVGVVVMKALAGGELRYGAPALDVLAPGSSTIASALRYAVMHPFISTVVVGMRNSLELRKNLDAIAGVGDNDLAVFDEWTRTVAALDAGECTRCGACLGVCPEGIEIPKIFRLYDQLRFFGMDKIPYIKYAELEVNASACLGCGKCQERCPEPFDIAALLESAHAALAI